MTLLLTLSLAGLAFAGYMSCIRLLTHTCALGEKCPTCFGYPACYFGFGMYLLMVLALFAALRDMLDMPTAVLAVRYIASAGILFSGYFTLGEIGTLFTRGLHAFVLGLPTCAWGLLFYIAILAATFAA